MERVTGTAFARAGLLGNPSDGCEGQAIAVYLYPPGIAARVDAYLAEGGDPDAPGHFVAWLVARTRVDAVPLDGEWFDIGDADTLAAARARFTG